MSGETSFQKLRDDWRLALASLLKPAHDDDTIASFVLVTDRMLDEVVNRSMGMAIQGAGIVASREKLDAIAAELHEVRQMIDDLRRPARRHR